jgi:hypothetical protein
MFSAIQLKSEDATPTILPFVLYRENPGIHIIALDGANYLRATTATVPYSGAPGSRERENNLLKYRAMCDKKDIGVGKLNVESTLSS